MLSNKKNSLVKAGLFFILIILLDLVFLYFIKYKNQSLSILEFNFRNIGNLINLLVYVIFLIGLVVLIFNQTRFWDSKYFIVLFFINQLFLVSAYISTIFTMPFNSYYYLGQNGNKLFTGLLFTLFQFSLFVMIFLIWLYIWKAKNLLLLRALLNSLLLMIFLLIFSFIYIIGKESTYNEKKIINYKNNVAVVLGAAVWSNNQPSPSLAARVDKALNLLDNGKVNSIYLTGSNAPGELSESEVALRYIKKKKVITSNIFTEAKTTSTNEQIRFIKQKLLSDSQKKNIIVISDSYHLVRVSEISKFQNIKIQLVASDLSYSFEKALYFKLREALALTVFWFFAF
jgi:vancomycin permeability regulator SanA